MTTDERLLGERLAVVEERVKEMQKDVRAILVQIEGPPREGSIRDRLHKIEDSEGTAKAASAALEAAKTMYAQAQKDSDRANEVSSRRRFSLIEASVGIAIAAFGATGSILAILTYLGSH